MRCVRRRPAHACSTLRLWSLRCFLKKVPRRECQPQAAAFQPRCFGRARPHPKRKLLGQVRECAAARRQIAPQTLTVCPSDIVCRELKFGCAERAMPPTWLAAAAVGGGSNAAARCMPPACCACSSLACATRVPHAASLPMRLPLPLAPRHLYRLCTAALRNSLAQRCATPPLSNPFSFSYFMQPAKARCSCVHNRQQLPCCNCCCAHHSASCRRHRARDLSRWRCACKRRLRLLARLHLIHQLLLLLFAQCELLRCCC